ncbi:MAG: hypothetical protein DRI86_09920 [Bacteroidetes bacterium]|nr:MAG: hypothetical protein DRI86_09920 [Bacteroidota bacterium]
MIYLFFEGILLGLLVAISLGPAFFAILQTGINKGFRYGIYMALGVLMSDVLLVTISYLIGATIFDNPENKVYVGLIGGIILIIFGSVSWAKKPEILNRRRYTNKDIKESRPFGYMVRGFFLNIANPFLFFFWFGALGFVGKNAIPGEILESTIIFFSGTFITIFFTDVLKSFIGGKIKGFLKPRKEIMLNKTVGLLLVTFGIVLIFRTLSGFGFFQQIQNNLQWGKKIEAQYNVSAGKSTLHLTLYKDSTFQERIDTKGNIYLSSGDWHFTDTVNHIFEITIHKSNLDTIKVPQIRTYKIDYTGISLYTDTTTLYYSPLDFEINKEFTIVNIHKANIIIPNIENIKVDCNGWNLNNQQITNIINNSVFIESKIWEEEFDIMPCVLDIRVKQASVLYHIQMNAGGWFSVNSSDSTIYYGNYVIENKGLFL